MAPQAPDRAMRTLLSLIAGASGDSSTHADSDDEDRRQDVNKPAVNLVAEQQEQSMFLQLPREIRDQIYIQAFGWIVARSQVRQLLRDLINRRRAPRRSGHAKGSSSMGGYLQTDDDRGHRSHVAHSGASTDTRLGQEHNLCTECACLQAGSDSSHRRSRPFRYHAHNSARYGVGFQNKDCSISCR
jgi:hypothetical protein